MEECFVGFGLACGEGEGEGEGDGNGEGEGENEGKGEGEGEDECEGTDVFKVKERDKYDGVSGIVAQVAHDHVGLLLYFFLIS